MLGSSGQKLGRSRCERGVILLMIKGWSRTSGRMETVFLRRIGVFAVVLVTSALLVVNVFTQSAQATGPYYVSTTGSGSACSVSVPCTFTTAVTDVNSSGGTIYLASGTYSIFSLITISYTGNVTIQAEPGASPALNGGTTSGLLSFNNTSTVATVSGITIENGSNSGAGGGIYNRANLTVSNVTFSNNVSGNSAMSMNGNGGAIYNFGTLSVTDSTFNSNSVVGISGGSSGSGGAIYSGTNLTVSDSTFSGDSAPTNGDGGAIYFVGPATISDSTFAGNSAVGNGGAIQDIGTGTFTNSTFSGNTATSGPDIWNGHIASAGADIFGDSCFNAGATWNDLGYNAVPSSNGCLFAGAGDVTSATVTSDLGSLTANGGPTQTKVPAAGSAAIGMVPTGTATYCPAGGVADQRGGTSAAGSPCNAGSVQLDAQTITFTSAAPTNPPIGGPTYTVTATGGNSGNPVVLSLDGTSSGCSIVGSTVSFTGSGTCKIDANQAGISASDWLPATQTQQLISVGTPPTHQNPMPTSTSLTASANSVNVGATATLAVSVTSDSGTPEGTVTVSANGAVIQGCIDLPLNGGDTSCPASFASANSYLITATFNGTGLYFASTSPAVTLDVSATTSTTTSPVTSTTTSPVTSTTTPPVTSTTTPPVTSTGGNPGYVVINANGSVGVFGNVSGVGLPNFGSDKINGQIVGSSVTPNGRGYWVISSGGGIYAFGDAGFFGAPDTFPLADSTVAMAATPDGNGYWAIGSDGGVFAFGDAGFFGSCPTAGSGCQNLSSPIVGFSLTADSKGYWEVASDGEVFPFGDAVLEGSAASNHLSSSVIGIASSSKGGYWVATANGAVLSFGGAGKFGDASSLHLNAPIKSIQATPDGGGFWLFASDGGVFAFGDAVFEGSSA